MTHTANEPRKVLALAVGLTPQVVTETIYALAIARTPAWIPDQVKLITTAEGAMRARLTLLDPAEGQFHKLCSSYGLEGRIRFTTEDIVVVEGAAGPLPDIRSPAENALAADQITGFIRNLCADSCSELHVSIAGGRKSMGYYIGYAMSLFGREQDRLSHVLVSEPFERIPEFFFPPAVPKVMFGPGNRPASTGDARIELAEIPFVRLRSGLPQALLSGAASFGATVEAASRQFAPASLRLEAAGTMVHAGPKSFSLPPMLWAWYALMAEARKTGAGIDGAVRYTDLAPTRLLAFQQLAAGPLSSSAIQLEEQLRREGGIPEQFFREKTAKLNRLLRERLAANALSYLVHPQGRRPTTRYGLQIAAARINLPC